MATTTSPGRLDWIKETKPRITAKEAANFGKFKAMNAWRSRDQAAQKLFPRPKIIEAQVVAWQVVAYIKSRINGPNSSQRPTTFRLLSLTSTRMLGKGGGVRTRALRACWRVAGESSGVGFHQTPFHLLPSAFSTSGPHWMRWFS
ncbi:MAG: hypothetical protein H7Z75_18535 [Ferruginibacter sp.]|nr:hypothetical protein [Cytophagales bacterium]